MRPPSSSPSRHLTITLAPSTYSRVVDLAAVDDRPVARMAAVILQRALTTTAPFPHVSPAAEQLLEGRRRCHA